MSRHSSERKLAVMIVKADLLTCGAQMIVQQNNCYSRLPHGLSESIAKKWPDYASIYGKRRPLSYVCLPGGPTAGKLVEFRNIARKEDRPDPGTILLARPGVPTNLALSQMGETKQQSILSSKRFKLNPRPTSTESKTAASTSSATVSYRPIIACLFAQSEMGKPGVYQSAATASLIESTDVKVSEVKDTGEQRLKWFKQCLDKLLTEVEAELLVLVREHKNSRGNDDAKKNEFTVAFPYGIGCNLAGGDWKLYYPEIQAWAEKAAKFGCKTIICKKE
jgi:hypothetical protein